MEENSTSENNQPDAQSFVEHLRLVHFTLIAASLVILIAITSQEKSSAARAYTQIYDLMNAGIRWQSGQWATSLILQKRPGILHSKGAVDHDEVAVEAVDPPKSGDVAEFLSQFRLVAKLGNSWRLTDVDGTNTGKSIGSDFRIADNDDSDKFDRAPNFNNLDGAAKIWDRLYRFQHVVFVKELKTGWYIPHSGVHADVLNLIARENSTDSTENRKPKMTLFLPGLLLRQDLVDLLKRGPGPPGAARHITDDPEMDNYITLLKLVLDDKDTQCYYFDRLRFQLILLRAECVVDHLPLQPDLIAGLISAIPLGDFARSFPDVDELAKHLRALSLEDLLTFFQTEKNRTGEQIELPGVKVPGEAVTSWGAAILFALLCYFGIVLREFSLQAAPNDKAWAVPWIGTSLDSLSRASFLVSILFVLFVVSYLGMSGASQNSAAFARMAYLLAPVSTAAVTVFITFSWRKVLRTRSRRA